MLVLVHTNLAVGNHTNKQYTETLSTVRFGDSTRARRTGGPLGRTTTDTSLPTVADSKDHTVAKIIHDPIDDGYDRGKHTHEIHELMDFADNRSMV